MGVVYVQSYFVAYTIPFYSKVGIVCQRPEKEV